MCSGLPNPLGHASVPQVAHSISKPNRGELQKTSWKLIKLHASEIKCQGFAYAMLTSFTIIYILQAGEGGTQRAQPTKPGLSRGGRALSVLQGLCGPEALASSLAPQLCGHSPPNVCWWLCSSHLPFVKGMLHPLDKEHTWTLDSGMQQAPFWQGFSNEKCLQVYTMLGATNPPKRKGHTSPQQFDSLMPVFIKGKKQ